MKKFRFKLEALLHLRENRRKSCRQLLGQLVNDENAIQNEKKEVLRKKDESLKSLKETGSSGTIDLRKISNTRYYLSQLTTEALVIDQRIEIIKHQIALCKKALVKADQEVKVLEKLKEKKQSEFLENELKAEALELEEAWLATHLSGGKQL